jgi:hypothetical protein
VTGSGRRSPSLQTRFAALRRIGLRSRLARRSESRTRSPWADVEGDAPAPGSGPTVLCATSVGGHTLARVVDSVIATSLLLRGARPHLLLCDHALPACEACSFTGFPEFDEFATRGPQSRLCRPCFDSGRAYYKPLPVPLHRYRDYIRDGEIAAATAAVETWSVERCFSFEDDGLRLGEQTRASTMRFFGKALLDDEPPGVVETTARRYAAGAIVAARVAARAIAKLEPDVVMGHHGVYVPQGVLGEVARRHGVRVVNWGPSYRAGTAIFSHGDTYHRTFPTEPVDLWRDRPLSPEQEQELLDYLAQRRAGKGDWSWVTPDAALRPELQEAEQLVRELELDQGRPIFGLLTNVLWDAQLYYEGHAFANMLDWLWATIDHFVAHPELQLILRVHPHEVKAGNRQPVEPELRRRYPDLPANVKVIPYDHSYNTYALMALCRAVLIYGTKTGVELAPFGMPVVVAADAWIRNKGLTIDASSREEYARILDRLPELEPLDAETIAAARRFAYHYFFRRMIPLRAIETEGEPRIRLTSLDELRPGADPGLDAICAGILTGSPFMVDAA